jgi:predicted DsbA family dithiol-disulfide isomerase
VLWSPEHLVLGAPEKSALVTLVVFTDYACPFCLRHEVSLRALLQRHSKDLRVVFRHHPLERHPAAGDIAGAALAAHELGLGEAYHARLTSGERSLIPGDPTDAKSALVALAEELGLPRTAFRDAMKRHTSRVQQDFQESRDRLGVSGTPYTFVNGWKVRGAVPLSDLEQVVEAARKRAQKVSQKRGLTGKALYRFLVGASGTPR